MNRRLSILSAITAIAILGAPGLVSAAEPTLSATVIPGQEIDLVGSGFPADADVQLTILRNGADAGSQALHADANGSFSATVDAGPGRGGVYTLTATSGSFSATVEALAVETAGGLQSNPPPTDTAPGGSSSTGSDSGWMAVLVLAAAGSLSLALSAIRSRPGRGAPPAGHR